ncbi:MAG: hypothetical protein WC243_04440, partial [Patescibacteria group bacterium]
MNIVKIAHYPKFLKQVTSAKDRAVHTLVGKDVPLKVRIIAWVSIVLVISFVFLFVNRITRAAEVVWDGEGTDGTCGGSAGDGNKWSCGLNWSTNSVPTSSDTAKFDGTSTKSVTLDSATSVAGVNIASGYTGTITQSAAITVGSSGFVQNAGRFSGSTQAIDVNGDLTLGAGVTFTATSGSLYVERSVAIDSSVVFDANSGTLALDGGYAGNTSVGASGITFSVVTINRNRGLAAGSYALTINSGTTIPLGDNPSVTVINTYDGYDLVNNGTITAGTGTLTVNMVNGTLTNNGTITATNITTWAGSANLTNSGTITATSSSTIAARSITNSASS